MKGTNPEEWDPWTSPDKLHHILFSFTLTLTFSLLFSRSPPSFLFLRSHPTLFGSTLSLFIGAAKEVADHFGYFNSSGASVKDAVADFVGVVLGCVLIMVTRRVYLLGRWLKWAQKKSGVGRGGVELV